MSVSEEELRRIALEDIARRGQERRRQEKIQQTQLSQVFEAAARGLDPLGPSGSPAGERLAANPRVMAADIGKGIVGLGENVANIAVSAIAEPIAGIVGGAEIGVRAAIPGSSQESRGNIRAAAEEGVETMESIRGVAESIAGPRTEAGQAIQEAIASPFIWLDKKVNEQSWHPLVKAGVLSIPGVAATLLGAKPLVRSASARRAAEAELDQIAADLGLDLRSQELRRQIGAAGEELTVPTRGAGMTEAQRQLQALADANRQHRNDVYRDARATNADVDAANVAELHSRSREALTGGGENFSFDLANTSRFRDVNERLAEIEALSTSGDRAVLLNEIQNIRDRINDNRPSRASNPKGNRALDALKGEIDEWLEDMITRDLVRGDQNAVQAWRDARWAHQVYAERFRDNKTIRKLVEELDAKPETIRNYVFGANQAGFGTQAAEVLSRIRSLVGKDSPAWLDLQMESMFHIMEPLMGDVPNLAGFIRRYDTFVRRNDSAMRVLEINRGPLEQLYRFAKAAEKTGAAPLSEIDIIKSGVRLGIGHNISRRGMMVENANILLRRMIGVGRSERRRIMQEMIGYQPDRQIFTGVAYAAVLEAELAHARRENQQQ